MVTIHQLPERHSFHRMGWLRASVLGANDGLLSTASLLVGMAVAHTGRSGLILAGVAAMAAGALSMAAGEYVSVSSQADSEHADLEYEKSELENFPLHELEELAKIYEARGLESKLAEQVAIQLMNHDAIGAHARDELGIITGHRVRPIQAALSSAAAFSVGAFIPLLIVLICPVKWLILTVSVTTLISIGFLGGLSAFLGHANMVRGAIRVTFWGAIALSATAGIGILFGVAI